MKNDEFNNENLGDNGNNKDNYDPPITFSSDNTYKGNDFMNNNNTNQFNTTDDYLKDFKKSMTDQDKDDFIYNSIKDDESVKESIHDSAKETIEDINISEHIQKNSADSVGPLESTNTEDYSNNNSRYMTNNQTDTVNTPPAPSQTPPFVDTSIPPVNNNQNPYYGRTYTSTYNPNQQNYSTPVYGSYNPQQNQAPNQTPNYNNNQANNNYNTQQQTQTPNSSYNPNYKPSYTSPYKPYTPNYKSDTPTEATPIKPKKNTALKVLALILVVCLIIGIGSAAGYFIFSYVPDNNDITNTVSSFEETTSTAPGLEITDTPAGTGTDTTVDGLFTPKQIYSKCSPSVVAITATSSSIDPFTNTGSTGYGSGIIMSEDGYIITNAHVLGSSKNTFTVELSTGQSYPATFIAADAKYDIGIIKISASSLVPATFGDSSKLTVGDPVYAIGNPGGPELQSSFSQGIVSGLNRTVIIENYNDMKYIQTDAAINPGNSGGALINEYGQVIGINTAKVSDAGFEGLGFAIPIKDAQPIIDELKASGKISNRARLGVTLYEIDESIADRYNMPKGLMVYDILPESDFLAKGVQKSDIITKINGTNVYTMDELTVHIKDKKPGDEITVTIARRERSIDGDNTFGNAYVETDYTIALIEDSTDF